MTKEEAADKRTGFFQSLNTVILTVIGILAVFISVSVNSISNEQSSVSRELMRLKTVQDNTVDNVKIMEGRMKTIEGGLKEEIKTWVDNNYVRKQQR